MELTCRLPTCRVQSLAMRRTLFGLLSLSGLAAGWRVPAKNPTGRASRRAFFALAAASTVAPAAFADEFDSRSQQAAVVQQSLQALNAGSRKLSDEGLGDGDLVAELLRRTEANKERNAALVRKTTEGNAYQAIDGSVNRRLVTDLTGRNRYLDAKEIRALTLQRRLACAPSVMEPCRMVEPSAGADAPPLQLPEVKALTCDADGRNCKFR